MRSMRRSRGITLIELAVVVAVVAILMSIAYPSYVAQVQKSRRTEAKAALLGAAVQMQRYFTERNTFATATLGSTGIYPASSEGGYYTLTLANLTATSFTIRGTPTGAQAADPCGAFTYDHLGVKGVSGGTKTAEECWR